MCFNVLLLSCFHTLKFDVITFGSATYDTFVLSKEFQLKRTDEGVLLCEVYGKKVELEEYLVTTGGGATNAAVCFERMGLQSGVIACVGDDYWGRIVKDQLAQEGVSLIHLQTTQEKPTSSSIVLVGKDGGRTILVYRAASNVLSWHNVDWRRLQTRWLYVSSMGGDFAFLSKILRLAKDKEMKIAFNPGSGELQEPDRMAIFLKHTDIVLFNKQEALQYCGQDSSESLKTDKINNIGAQLTVITDGRKGAWVYPMGGKPLHQPAIAAKVVEETGAGDAFGAAFVVGQMKGFSFEQSLKLAAYNSASVVEQIGAKAGLLFWPEARKKLDL